MILMPSSDRYRKAAIDCGCREKLDEKSSPFLEDISGHVSNKLRRPRTLPNLQSLTWMTVKNSSLPNKLLPRQPSKLLLNVMIQASLGPVHVVMTHKNTVGDLVSAAVRQYVKEGRRPILLTDDPTGFNLHFSQFILESKDRMKKLLYLGSRNFFLCRKKKSRADDLDGRGFTTPFGSSCCPQGNQKLQSRNLYFLGIPIGF